jgi:hypothetical protein
VTAAGAGVWARAEDDRPAMIRTAAARIFFTMPPRFRKSGRVPRPRRFSRKK